MDRTKKAVGKMKTRKTKLDVLHVIIKNSDAQSGLGYTSESSKSQITFVKAYQPFVNKSYKYLRPV